MADLALKAFSVKCCICASISIITYSAVFIKSRRKLVFRARARCSSIQVSYLISICCHFPKMYGYIWSAVAKLQYFFRYTVIFASCSIFGRSQTDWNLYIFIFWNMVRNVQLWRGNLKYVTLSSTYPNMNNIQFYTSPIWGSNVGSLININDS